MSLNYKFKDITNLKYPSFIKSRQGKIWIGKIINQGKIKQKFFLSIEDLEKHMFICGSTGTGKSNFVQNFILSFKKQYNIPFLLIEFKGEYVFLQKYVKDLLIFKPGENFSINIFDPENSNPEIHAERIFNILKSGYFFEENADYSPQMQKVLVEILTEVCKKKENQNWDGFYKHCDIYLEQKKREIPMLQQTLISIKNRIRRFSIGPLTPIFCSNNKIKSRNLFKKNTVIDLSSIIRLGGEKEDALFFLNVVLKYLWDENLVRGAFNYNGIKHITIVEDAQYFAPKNIAKRSKISTYLEDIALLQRGTGECLISIATRPQISEEILANCGVLIIFKNHMEKELQCKLLNLNEKYEYYLSILEKGQCLIRVNSIKRPFSLKIPIIKREYLTNKEISYNNQIVLNKISIDEKNLSKINSSPLKMEKYYRNIIKVNSKKKEKNQKQKPLTINKEDIDDNLESLKILLNNLYIKEKRDNNKLI
ncbi:MAG: ATP-binding protein [Candidatus Lokiarchaeota archaeon]|nr:ATP-binding protein [Candidatus Lokiarchaeota archaeon]